MERFDLIIKSLAAVSGGTLAYLFGGWSGVLGVLLVLIVLDYVTGVVAAGVAGELRSNTGLIGIARKVFIFAMVAVGHLVDSILGDSHFFRDTVSYFYIANELLSLIENGGKLGAPIPPSIRQAIEVLKGKGSPTEEGDRPDASKK